MSELDRDKETNVTESEFSQVTKDLRRSLDRQADTLGQQNAIIKRALNNRNRRSTVGFGIVGSPAQQNQMLRHQQNQNQMYRRGGIASGRDVRIVNPNEISEPIVEASNGNAKANGIRSRYHHEQQMYWLKSINTAVWSDVRQGKPLTGQLFVREFKKFRRMPMWYTFDKFVRTTVKTASATTKLLTFGFGKKKPTDELILKAVKEQTEYMMTGQIDRRNDSLTDFVRLIKENGLLGQTARFGVGTIANTIGLGRRQAQQSIDKSVRGEKLSWRERMLIDQYVVGAKGRSLAVKGNANGIANNFTLDKAQTKSSTINFGDLIDQLKTVVFQVKNVDYKTESQSARQTIQAVKNLTVVSKQSNVVPIRRSSESIVSMKRDATTGQPVNTIGQISKIIPRSNTGGMVVDLSESSTLKQNIIAANNENTATNKSILKLNKKQLKEQIKLRKDQSFRAMMSFATRGVGMLAGITSSILGRMGLGGLVKNTKLLRRIPLIGTAALGATSLLDFFTTSKEDRDSKWWGGFGGRIAGTLAGAKYGAMGGGAIGSAVPIVGTAAGAVIGGIIGAIGGAIGGEKIGSWILPIAERAWTSIKNEGISVFSDITSWWGNAKRIAGQFLAAPSWEAYKVGMVDMFDNTMTLLDRRMIGTLSFLNEIPSWFTTTTTTVESLAQRTGGMFVGMVQNIQTNIAGVFTDIKTSAVNKVNSIFDGIGERINQLVTQVRDSIKLPSFDLPFIGRDREDENRSTNTPRPAIPSQSFQQHQPIVDDFDPSNNLIGAQRIQVTRSIEEQEQQIQQLSKTDEMLKVLHMIAVNISGTNTILSKQGEKNDSIPATFGNGLVDIVGGS